MDHLQTDDIIIGVRQRRKQTEPISCPVCSITLRPSEMEHHYSIEVDRLHKLQTTGSKPKRSSTNSIKDQIATCSSSGSTGNSNPATTNTPSTPSSSSSTVEQIDPKECWNTYQRIKNNRQARLKVRFSLFIFSIIVFNAYIFI